MARWHTAALTLALALALAGCGLTPIPYPTPTSEMPNQPGLFTGQSGEATIYRQP